MGVGKDLNLDVARLREVALQEQLVIAEGGAREPLRRTDCRRDFARRVHHLHSLSTAPRARLDDERKAHSRGLRLQPLERLIVAVVTRGHRHSDGRHGGFRGALRAHRADRRRRRSDERQPRIDTGLRKIGILRQEAIARMYRIRADALRHLEHAGGVEVALGRGRGAQIDTPRRQYARASRRGQRRSRRQCVVHPRRCAVRAIRQTISPRLATSRRFEKLRGITRSHSKDAELRRGSALTFGSAPGRAPMRAACRWDR